MNPIAVVIPTLREEYGISTGKLALATAGTAAEVELVVSVDIARRGFTKTANAGMRKAKASADICLLNDDIGSFCWGWLEELRSGLYSNSSYGAAGPSGPSGTSPMKDGRPGQVGIQVVGQLPMWAFLVKRAVLDQLGLLDEELIHYCSDNLFCHKMRLAGWKCVWIKSVYLEHQKHGSGYQGAWREHDRKIFFRKLAELGA